MQFPPKRPAGFLVEGSSFLFLRDKINLAAKRNWKVSPQKNSEMKLKQKRSELKTVATVDSDCQENSICISNGKKVTPTTLSPAKI